MPQRNKAIILFSGGIESTILTLEMQRQGYETELLFFQLKQNKVDKKRCEILAPLLKSSLRISDLSEALFPSSNNYPLRNLVFSLIGVQQAIACDAKIVGLGLAFFNQRKVINKPEFLRQWQNLLQSSEEARRIKISTPFLHFSKTEVLKLGKCLLANKFTEIMNLTYSCYRHSPIPCGECEGCINRQNAFSGLKLRESKISFKE